MAYTQIRLSNVPHLSSVDKTKDQSSNLSSKDQHDDQKELRRKEKEPKVRRSEGQQSAAPVSHTHQHKHTYKTQAEFGLPDGGAAAHQAENEHHRADADDDHGGDQSVSVLDEAVEVVIALDHVGSHVGQRRPCSLWGRTGSKVRT